MRVNRIVPFIIVSLLVSPSFCSIDAVANQSSDHDKPIIDFIRGLEIKFDSPQLIQDCGGVFLLNVTFTKTKLMNLPRLFSASVFLKIKDEFNKNKIIRIGSQPFIYIPSSHISTTVSIPCLTNNNFLTNLYRLRSGEKNEFKIRDAAIGVRIEKAPHWILFDRFLWNSLVINEIQGEVWFQVGDNTLWRSFKDNSLLPDRKPVMTFRLFSFLQWSNSRFKERNPFIVWDDIKVVSPFVCSKDVFIDYYRIDEKTDKNGTFQVNVSITNNLNENITAGVLIDMSDQPIINTLVPVLKVTRYNVGYFEKHFLHMKIITEPLIVHFQTRDLIAKSTIYQYFWDHLFQSMAQVNMATTFTILDGNWLLIPTI